MNPRVYIIHGWNGHPSNAWFPWLRDYLTEKGMDVYIPSMPRPMFPSPHAWIRRMDELVGECTPDTYFIGHSLGAQAVLRYLASLPKGMQAGGAVAVGGFARLGDGMIRRSIANIVMNSWLTTPLATDIVPAKCRALTAFFSAEDTWVTSDNIEFFARKLNARVNIVHGYGHFTKHDRVFALPEAAAELLRLADMPVPRRENSLVHMAPSSRWRMAWDMVHRALV